MVLQYPILTYQEDKEMSIQVTVWPIRYYRDLKWKAEKSVEDMCRDSWKFIIENRSEKEI